MWGAMENNNNDRVCLGKDRVCVLVGGLMWCRNVKIFIIEWVARRQQNTKSEQWKFSVLLWMGRSTATTYEQLIACSSARHRKTKQIEIKKHNTDCDGECYCACDFSFQLDDVRSPKSVWMGPKGATHISMRPRTFRSSFSAATSRAWKAGPALRICSFVLTVGCACRCWGWSSGASFRCVS